MSALNFKAPRACVVSLSGPEFTEAEREFISELDPFGLILFARNVESPDQLRKLTADFRQVVQRSNAPILIDQEGGRVQRLRPPHWRKAPPAAVLGSLYDQDADTGREAVYLNARLLAAELLSVGVTVDCAPVLDVPVPGAHDVIGDRAFGWDISSVSMLGAAALAGFLDAGVVPVIKHLPGHGRAQVDSHKELPVVKASHEDLAASDFMPFQALKDAPYAMSAHVVYTAIDSERPATQSPIVIDQIIRGEIGFQGCLFSDDLGMEALSGSIADRAEAALDAGCDIALHCSGDFDEMRSLLDVVPRLSGASLTRAYDPISNARPLMAPDIDAWKARLNELMQHIGPLS